MLVCETSRLIIRQFTIDDAPFIFRLLNTEIWLTYIGDRNIRGLDDARNYLVNGPLASYDRFGFGLYLVALKGEHTPVGMTGLIKRNGLEEVDIGFAFLPEYTGKGYAFEAASAIKDHALATLKLPRVAAITTEKNIHAINLLEKIGLHHEKMVLLPGNNTEFMYFVN
ncbi:GNAT family N-acetyltransferase [Chitinophaga ginsengisoli]|uniref:RimJ/RimL family protein N-acetyltransferase n=1 Tax=Chitinophaga ginsengisoli TaxID=363837 RepID=A0A2P8G2Y9_9BACT|nr:GNAT family N-acetyltransferase [Chitinophaga ginsengisoli]PSL28329.1 RimJ/RimL family protein N-acetyltransferase [Chitinophaga ginsengisoli]